MPMPLRCDLGLVCRNIALAGLTHAIILVFFNCNARFIDYGRGYVLLVRIMRDRGLDVYRSDKYAQNLFAQGFEADEKVHRFAVECIMPSTLRRGLAMLGKRSAQLGLFEADKKIDWDDTQQKDELLQSIVADADRLLDLAREKLSMCSQASAEGQRLREAAGLLSQILLQDIEREAEGAAVKEGVSADRVVSVQDPEMRHGRKSKA